MARPWDARMIACRRYHRAGVQGMQQSLPSIFALGATERAGAPAHGKDALAARCTARAAEKAGRLRRCLGPAICRPLAASAPPRTGCPKRPAKIATSTSHTAVARRSRR